MVDLKSGITTNDPEVDFAALASGEKIGRYEILSVLGHGGFGITYCARDADFGREVAIKEYLPVSLAVRQGGNTVLPRSTKVAEDFIWGRDRFVAEGRTLATLALGAAAPATPAAAAPAAAAPAAAAPAPAGQFDGNYGGPFTFSGSHASHGATFGRTVSVNVLNGNGTGTLNTVRCGSAPISLTISPAGDITGQVSGFDLDCGSLTQSIRGRATNGQLNINFNGVAAGQGRATLTLRTAAPR